ncbi:hypothetical protein JR316_0007785 [Psilocybe cubensis]|uniref:Uncharacterized protein n=1 Tax=Psilocybe cubensis TaxID=181762 RepID=A0ACB8GUC6_PSICU|nr:hypothetical protein JR316_0007785 [Psilocybe cubensis]KAH9479199.1 hypothetical protein JR316_0007785 [Psilocybe cubensis]
MDDNNDSNGSSDSEESDLDSNAITLSGFDFWEARAPSVGAASDRNPGLPGNLQLEADFDSEMCMDPQPSSIPIQNCAPGGTSLLDHNALRASPAFVDCFEGHAGAPIHTIHPDLTRYASYGEKVGSKENRWAPFSSEMDWKIAQWAKLQGPSATAFNELLEIGGLCSMLGLLYKNSKELNQLIDKSLPRKRPTFECREIEVEGEVLEYFSCDVLECIRELYGNPEHAQYLAFVPERHYSDANRTMRLYHEIYTGRWWWSTQASCNLFCGL